MDEKSGKAYNDRRLESLALLIYTIHELFMFGGSIKQGGDRIWLSYIILFVMVTSWLVYLRKNTKYSERVLYSIVAVQVSMFCYLANGNDLLTVIAPYCGIVVLIGLYGVPKLFLTAYVSFTCMVLYQMIFAQSFDISNSQQMYEYMIPVMNVYSVIGLVHFWVIQRDKSQTKIEGVIRALKSTELSRDDFMANVNHEIRTPINTISGMSEVILREELPDHIREKIQDIQTSGRNLLTVVNDMLDFSELQSGRQTIVDVPYNITSTVNDVINMANAWKSDKNIELIVDCNTDIPKSLLGDEQKVRRVILGLMNNAIKFTNDGCVTLQVDFRKEKYGINLLVSVRDTGIGIDEKHQEKLFTSFSQVDTKRNRQEGGVGLGLAIAQALVEQMGGYLSVKSQLGKGSEFQFVIPQKVDEPEPIISIGSIVNKFNILIYISMEQFDMMTIRDEYTNMIIHMTSQLNVRFHLCRNLAEFKRRAERDVYSHAFISFQEYKEDEDYFTQLSGKIKVVAIVEPYQDKEIKSSGILRVFKPFYVLSVVRILRGEDSESTRSQNYYRKSHFVAPKAKVLVVDDSIINLKVVSGLLKPYKISTVTALSGAEALDKIESREFDLVFMDHMMPEMDGIEAFHRIRNKKGMYFKEIPIIALTANAVAGAREMFLAEGFQDFVAKPIEISVLERSLKAFLPEDKIEYVVDHIEVSSGEKTVEQKQEKPMDKILKVPSSQQTVEQKQEKPMDKMEQEIPKNVGENTQMTDEKEFTWEDIDIDQGVTYCGSMEDFMDILEIHYSDGAENSKKIQAFYEQKDWKNYTILVHGLKSSMKTVGIMKLSEMAKQLEAAGKTEDEGFIQTNHQPMMEEYRSVLKVLEDKFGEATNDAEDLSGLEELSDEQMEDMLSQFEDAVYTWEEENMVSIIQKMQDCQYHGKAIKEPLQAIFRKIEMSDYMSALDTLKSLVEKWKKG